MRTRMMILTGALLLVFSGAARAQQEQAASSQDSTKSTPMATSVPASTTPFTPKLGQIDFGFRGDSVSGDAARYKETEQWVFKATANNVGYRDQRFTVNYQDIGRLKVNGDWNQVPLFISDSTRRLYKDNGNGVLTIDDSI